MAKTKIEEKSEAEIEVENKNKIIFKLIADSSLSDHFNAHVSDLVHGDKIRKFLVGAKLMSYPFLESGSADYLLGKIYHISVNGSALATFEIQDKGMDPESSKANLLSQLLHSQPVYGGGSLEYSQTIVLPGFINDADMLSTILAIDTSAVSVFALTQLTSLTDQALAGILGMTVKTLRSYKQPSTIKKGVLKEHVVYLHTMFSHRNEAFGNKEAFTAWLTTPNFLLDNKTPVSHINSITGTKFIDTRLTAIEYGDKV